MLANFYLTGFILCLLGIVLCFLGDDKVQYEIIWEDYDEPLIDPIYRAKLISEKDTNA